MTRLSSPVQIVGLSKTKITAVLFIAGMLLGIALFFGVFEADEDKGFFQKLESKNETYQNSSTQDSINQILNEAEATKTRISASAAVASQPINTVTLQKIIPEVPPIEIRANETDEHRLTPEEKARMQFDKKQIDSKYTSFSSRTLVYSNRPTVAEEDDTEGAEQPIEEQKHVSPGSGLQTTGNKNNIVPENKNSVSKTEAKSFKTSNSKIKDSNYLDASLEKPRSPYEVKAGSVIPATMINGLNSDLPGQVIAQVRENIYDTVSRRYLLIPQGSRLVGLYASNVLYGQERILVAWNRLIYPDGSSINLKAMPGTDLEGYSGFHDIVDNKYWKIFGMSFVMGVLTGAMQYSQNNTNANVQIGGLGITSNPSPTIGQTMAGSLGQQLGQTGLMLAQKNLNVQPTLIVKPNYPFNIMITADMILRPYRSAKYR